MKNELIFWVVPLTKNSKEKEGGRIAKGAIKLSDDVENLKNTSLESAIDNVLSVLTENSISKAKIAFGAELPEWQLFVDVAPAGSDILAKKEIVKDTFKIITEHFCEIQTKFNEMKASRQRIKEAADLWLLLGVGFLIGWLVMTAIRTI